MKCSSIKNFGNILWIYMIIETFAVIPFVLFGISFPELIESLPKCFSSLSMLCLQMILVRNDLFSLPSLFLSIILIVSIFTKLIFAFFIKQKKRSAFIACVVVYIIDLIAFVCNSVLFKPQKLSLVFVHYFWGILFILFPIVSSIFALNGNSIETPKTRIFSRNFRSEIVVALPFGLLIEFFSAIFVFVDVISSSPVDTYFVDLKTQPIVHLILNRYMINGNIMFLVIAIAISSLNLIFIIAFIKNKFWAGKLLICFYSADIIINLIVRLYMVRSGVLVSWNLFLLALIVLLYLILILLCMLKIKQLRQSKDS